MEILQVEDNVRDAQLTLRVLKKHNLSHTVDVAHDGQEALNLIFGKDGRSGEGVVAGLRLVLLDLKLPKVDGFEVLRRLKTDERTKWIPIVILSSSNQERDIIKAYELGVNSYVIKPVDYEQFDLVISRMVAYWMSTNETPYK
ncbi:MAG: response regulator [Smithellaceae bacterium]|nr:response regulator [Smithellaceae bacterium]